MKKIFLVGILCLFFATINAQSYLGWVTSGVNLRQGPGLDYKVKSSLNSGAQIFIISLENKNGFVNVIDIASNTEGYVSRKLIKTGERIMESEGGLFQPTGATDTFNPEVKIYNNTNRTLTLKMNDRTFTFYSGERKKFDLPPDIYNYRASAKGVIPNIGQEILKSNNGYTWEFYILPR
jgi:uncharacterized protein YgiM (DUF1202 family)